LTNDTIHAAITTGVTNAASEGINRLIKTDGPLRFRLPKPRQPATSSPLRHHTPRSRTPQHAHQRPPQSTAPFTNRPARTTSRSRYAQVDQRWQSSILGVRGSTDVGAREASPGVWSLADQALSTGETHKRLRVVDRTMMPIRGRDVDASSRNRRLFGERAGPAWQAMQSQRR